MALSKLILSGSTNGKSIIVSATSTPGTTIHDCDASALDEVFLWAWNDETATLLLTLEWGGVSDPGNLLKVEIPAQGAEPTLLVPGWIGTGSINIDAFGASANKLHIFGYVNRIA